MGLSELVRSRAALRVGLVMLVGGAVAAVGVNPAAARIEKRPQAVRRLIVSPAVFSDELSPSALAVPSVTGLHVGREIARLRRARSDTFRVSGDPQAKMGLVTRIYPVPVNYRDASGRFVPINPALVSTGAGFVQRANNLGVTLPAWASGQTRSLWAPVRCGSRCWALMAVAVSGAPRSRS